MYFDHLLKHKTKKTSNNYTKPKPEQFTKFDSIKTTKNIYVFKTQ